MIFIAGPHGAGKSKVAQILRKYGIFSIDLGPTLRKIHKAQHHDNFWEWIREGEQRVGAHFTDNLLVEEIIKFYSACHGEREYKGISIVGNRSVEGIEYIKKRVPLYSGQNVILYIEAPFEILVERFNSRESKNLSKKDFCVLLEEDKQRGLEKIWHFADFIIHNSGDENSLNGVIEEMMVVLMGLY